MCPLADRALRAPPRFRTAPFSYCQRRLRIRQGALHGVQETTVIDQQTLSASPNHLLSRLPPRTLELIAPHCRSVRMQRREALTLPGRPVEAAFFIASGVASVVSQDGAAQRLELCLIGCEGFSGAPLVTGAGSWPYETFVQADELAAIAIDADPFQRCVAADAHLRRAALGAVHVQMVQMAEGLVSAVGQRLPARLARWLLMYHDRIGYDRLEVTHEFIAIMIGAQRTGVTAVLHDLEGRGLITAQRGLVIIRDRKAMKALASSGYGVPEGEQDRLRSRPPEAE